MDSKDIDKCDPGIAKFHAYWQRNREVIDGARSVVPNAANYLTREPGMDQVAFDNYVKRVTFEPAAASAFEKLTGLMQRTTPKIVRPDPYKLIIDVLTPQGFGIQDLAAMLDGERLITNYTGLLTDSPEMPKGLSKAQAWDLGYRPTVAVYRAESILGIEVGMVGNFHRVTRVRLLENANTVRELRLDDGVYSIILHRRREDGGEWVADAPIIPRREGKPLNEIPFTLDSSSRDYMPVNAPLGHVVALNISHYVASANLATEMYYSTVRIFVTGGLQNEVAAKLPAYSGARWNFEDRDVEREILSASDNVIADLRAECTALEHKMAIHGLRMLEGDAASNISTETQRIRDNAQNASLAAIVRRGDRAINDQLKWVAWFLGLAEGSMTYETNTDFGAMPMTAQDIAERRNLWQAGAISREEFLRMIQSELSEDFDPELDKQKIAEDMADRPTTEL